MSALQTPAADAPAKEWGRLAVSLPGWRWMPGMVGRNEIGGTDRIMDQSEASRANADIVPDPDDPATAGCLLALLGDERWRLHLDDVGEWSFWVNGPPQTDGTGHLIHVGESLGRACIAAAAGLGRWPGGEL